MEITFLGTSSGVPTKNRNVSGLAIKKQDSKSWFLVDCGEGTQQQLLQTKLSLKYLTAICITHVHGDHCYGMPGLLATTAMSGRTEPITIIAPEGIITHIGYFLKKPVLALMHFNLLNKKDFISQIISCREWFPPDNYKYSVLKKDLNKSLKKLSKRI